MKKFTYQLIIVFFFSATAVVSLPAMGQRYFNNPISQYYRDGYLWNPALAGQEGTRFYGLLNKSWIGFDGAPRQTTLAADTKLGEKFGIGLRATSDKSGVFERNMAAVSYAFVAKINEANRLRIGGEASFYKERLDNSAYDGQIDHTAQNFNQKGIQFDGDLGFALEGDNYSIGATGYNLGSYMQKSSDRSADLSMGQIMASYKFQCEEKINLQPLLAYKMFYLHENIFTAAMQLQYDNVFHAGLYWQSTGNAMGGLGIMYKNMGEINFFYSGKNKYGYNQQYELGLKLKLK